MVVLTFINWAPPTPPRWPGAIGVFELQCDLGVVGQRDKLVEQRGGFL